MDVEKMLRQSAWMAQNLSRLRELPDWTFGLSVAAIAAFGVFQASLGLGRSLTIDEPFVANMLHLGGSQMLETVWRHETPFYHVLLRGWVALLGESEVALRSFSALCFLLAIVTVGYTARRLGGVRAGWAAALLMSTSYIGLQHAGTARMYALLSLQVAIAALIVFRLVDLVDPSTPLSGTGNKSLYGALLIGVNATGLLNHSIYIFFMGTYSLAALLVSRRLLLVLTLCSLVSIALHLALWGPHLYELVRTPVTAWMQVPGLDDLMNGILRLWGSWNTLLLAVCLLALVLVRWRRASEFLHSRQGLLSGMMLVLLVALPFLVSQVKPVYFAIRTPALFLPMACVFLGLLLVRLGLPRPAVLLLLLLAISSLWTSAMAPPQEPGAGPAKASVRTVVERARCGDTVVSGSLAFHEVAYYLRRFDANHCLEHLTLPAPDPSLSPEAVAGEAESLIDHLLEGDQDHTVWLFYYSLGGHTDIVDELKRQLDQRMVLVERLDVRGSFFEQVLAYTHPGGKAFGRSPVGHLATQEHLGLGVQRGQSK